MAIQEELVALLRQQQDGEAWCLLVDRVQQLEAAVQSGAAARVERLKILFQPDADERLAPNEPENDEESEDHYERLVTVSMLLSNDDVLCLVRRLLNFAHQELDGRTDGEWFDLDGVAGWRLAIPGDEHVGGEP